MSTRPGLRDHSPVRKSRASHLAAQRQRYCLALQLPFRVPPISQPAKGVSRVPPNAVPLKREYPGQEQKRKNPESPPTQAEATTLKPRNYFVWHHRVHVHAKSTDQFRIRYDCPFCSRTHKANAHHSTSNRCEDCRCPCLPQGYTGFSIFITPATRKRIVFEPRHLPRDLASPSHWTRSYR